jgi:hypothetical protein
VSALAVVSRRDGRMDAVLVAALQDSAPARRATAAAVIGRRGTGDQKKALVRLLTDADAKVRLQAARGLIAGGDKKAVAALIGLISNAPIDLALQADELLKRLAQDKPPTRARLVEAVGVTDDAVRTPGSSFRNACRETWDDWWQAHQEKVDLARAEQEFFVDGAARARQVSRQCLTALFKGDAATVKKTTEAPFQFGSMELIEMREALDGGIDWLCQHIQKNERFAQVRPTLHLVISAEAYQRRGSSARLKDLIADQPRKPEVRVVYASLEGPDVPKGFTVLVVRVANGCARVIGIDSDAGPN